MFFLCFGGLLRLLYLLIPVQSVGYKFDSLSVNIVLEYSGSGLSITAYDLFGRERETLLQCHDLRHGQFRLTESVSDFDLLCRNCQQLVGVAVAADERWDFLTGDRVGQFYDSTEVAVLFEIGLIDFVEFVAHELIEFLLALDEVRNKLDAAVGGSAEREASLDVEFLATECRCDVHRLGLPVVEHLLQVTGGFKSLLVDAPFLFEHLPVDFTLIDSLEFRLGLLLRLAFSCGFLLRCLGLFLLLLRDFHLEVFEDFGICVGVLGEVCHSHPYAVIAVSQNFEKSED